VLADERPRVRRFLVLGSASPQLLKQSSESLAGRIAYEEIGPFNISEVTPRRWERLWARGGFPSSLLAADDASSFDWRRRFRQTFIERDLPALDLAGTPSSSALSRYWAMLAHVHGEPLNWSELGRSMGVSDVTARRYADVLEGALMVRTLKPWHENLGKRQLKAPKLYFRDSGLLHVQLGVGDLEALLRHPRCGASWEGFIIEQIIALGRLAPDEIYYWRTEHGAELDLLVIRAGKRIGFEVKRTAAPAVTPSMRIAIDDLRLDALYVVHAGTHELSLGPKLKGVPWSSLRQLVERVL
jgi:predicted AAA+ superfamily ATPase